jgi:hypothetical protein
MKTATMLQPLSGNLTVNVLYNCDMVVDCIKNRGFRHGKKETDNAKNAQSA